MPLTRSMQNDSASTASAQNVSLFLSFEDGDVEVDGLEVRKANGTTPFALQQVDFVTEYASGSIKTCVVHYRQEDTVAGSAAQTVTFHAVTPGTSTANNTTTDDETDIAALAYTAELVAGGSTYIASFADAITAGRWRVERQGPVALTLRVHAVPTVSGTPQTSHLVIGFITLYSDGTSSFEGLWINSFNQNTSSSSTSPITGITSLVIKKSGSTVVTVHTGSTVVLPCNGYMALVKADGQPYFTSNDTTFRVVHDREQMNRCGTMLYVDPTNYLSLIPSPSARDYAICNLLGNTNEINAAGGGEHIGLVPKFAANYWTCMADATKGKTTFREMIVRSQWLGIMDLSVYNTTNGWPWICNNTTYGSLTGSLNIEIGNGSSMTYTDSRSNDLMGNWGDLDMSHMVNCAFLPFIATGRPIFFEMQMIQANHTLLASNYTRSKTFSGTGVTINNLQRIGEVRALGWGVREQSNLMHVMPAGHPMAGYFQDMLTASCTWATQVNKAVNNISEAAALHLPTELVKLHNALFWSVPPFMNDFNTIALVMAGLRGQISSSDTLWTDLVLNFHFGATQACNYGANAFGHVFNKNNDRTSGKTGATMSQSYNDSYDIDTNAKILPDAGCAASGTARPYYVSDDEGGYTFPSIKNVAASMAKAYAALYGLTSLETAANATLDYLNAERVSQGFTNAAGANKVQWQMRDYRALT